MKSFPNSARNLLLSLLLATVILSPLPDMPGAAKWPLLFSVLEDSCHALGFFVLGIAFFGQAGSDPGSQRRKHYFVFAMLISGGIVSEYLQAFTGRDPSLLDAFNDAVGVTAAFFTQNLKRHGRFAATALCACCLWFLWPLSLVGFAYTHRATQFPLLWQADSLLDRVFLDSPTPSYPGFRLREPAADWRGFKSVHLEVRNDSDVWVTVTLRIHDGTHRNTYSDRYNETFALQPHARQLLEVPLDRVELAPQGRRLDMSDIRGVILFRDRKDAAHHVSVEAVRLVR